MGFCALSFLTKKEQYGDIIIVVKVNFSKKVSSLQKITPSSFSISARSPKLSKIGLCLPPSLLNFLSMADQNSPLVFHNPRSTTSSPFHRKLPIKKRRASVVRSETESSSATQKRPVLSCSKT